MGKSIREALAKRPHCVRNQMENLIELSWLETRLANPAASSRSTLEPKL
ncbi:MAG: hypothetical protein ACI8UP_004711, partial [Porticoccaceae bacterium]